MYQRILVPLDGSSRAEQSVPVAARIARVTPGGSVVLVRVVRPPFPAGEGAGSMEQGALAGPAGSAETDTEYRTVVAYLTRITGWPVLCGIPTSTEVRRGSAAPAILAAAEANASDLIVISSHGRTGSARWVLGSVAQQIVRHAPMPVLVLRERGPRLTGDPGDSQQPLRVLVPLDGSPLAEDALRPAARLALAVARSRAVTLELALVISPYDADVSHMPEALALLSAQTYLRRVAQQLEADVPDIRVAWRVSAGLDVAYTILRGADTTNQEVAASGTEIENSRITGNDNGASSLHYDLLAMATHGRTGFTRWATGSITERVLQGTHLPLLVVRAHAGQVPAETDGTTPARQAVRAGTRDTECPPAG